MSKMSHFTLTVTAFLLLALLPCVVSAVTCPSCNSGRRVNPESCECGCTGAYLPPTCTFTATDTDVRLIFYFSQPTMNYSIDLFRDAVAYTVDNTKTAATLPSKFLRAGDKMTDYSYVIVGVPGYGVQRVLDAVSYRDPWVAQYKVLSVHIFASDSSGGPSKSEDFDFILYEKENYIVSLSGVMWLAAALIVVILCVGSETCFSHNTEEMFMETGGSMSSFRRSSQSSPKGSPKNRSRDYSPGVHPESGTPKLKKQKSGKK